MQWGWFRWSSLAGFVVLGSLSLLALSATGPWAVSTTWTGIGTLALYFGHDPTVGRPRETTT